MFLSPSQVHFTSTVEHLGASKMVADSHIGDVYLEMKRRQLCPRLQVVKKSGHFFSLDNTRLYMMRRMEEEGHCKTVPVHQVMLKKVPEAVQRLMVLPNDVACSESPPPSPRRMLFRLRRASEQAIYGSPRRVKDTRDTKSITCSLETGRRFLKSRHVPPKDESESSDDDDYYWPDETESLL